MPSSSDYTNRILDETHRVLDPRISALQSAFESLRGHLLTSIEQLAPKLSAIKSIELPAAERIVSEAMKEAAWQNQVEVNLLAEFGSGMRRKETQEEILSLLLDTAQQFAHAVALFVARGDEITGWSSRGFGPDTAARFGNSSFAAADSALLRKALASDIMVTVSHPPEEALLQEIFQDEPLVSWHLLPMKALQRPIAVLVACDSEGRHSNLDSLRILMDITSLCVENLALKILQELRTAEAAEPGAAAAPEPVAADASKVEGAPPSPVAQAQPQQVPTVVPGEIAVHGEPVAQEEMEEEHLEVPSITEPSPSAPLEKEAVGARSGAPRDEPVAIPEPAARPHVIAAQFKRANAPEPSPAPAAAAPPPPMGPESEKLHADARRFARLLVSEIKLYNEQRLREARAGGQIYLRLKRDIDRSREMYERRFPFSASHNVDYFHDEIVRILADNDSAKLGADYPGPRVES